VVAGVRRRKAINFVDGRTYLSKRYDQVTV